MTDLRTAAQQALEALEMSRRFVYSDNRPQCDEAMDALRDALAQQDEPVVVSVDELANHIRVVDGNHSLGAGVLAEKIVEFLIERGISKERCDAGPRAALAQREEPVSEDAHTTTLRALLECCLTWKLDARVLGNVTARQAITALRAALAQPIPHGCHVYLDPGMKPDGCVLDDGRPENCIYAKRLLREGKDKTACEYWQPIEVTR